MSRIEQVISDIEAYLDDCKFQPFSNTKIIVDKDQLEDMLAELRLKTPEEIKKYQKIINNKEAILNDAKEQADAILGCCQGYRQKNLSMSMRLCKERMHRQTSLLNRLLHRPSLFLTMRQKMLTA